jgi:hypothetical protein
LERAVTSIGEIFQRLVGSVDAILEAALLLLVADREPVLDQDDAGARSIRSNSGAVEEVLVLLVGAEAHDVLDAGAVVPAAVEQDPLAGGRELGHVALEIPLRLLALGGDAEGARCGRRAG